MKHHSTEPSLEALQDVLGLDLPPERVAEGLAAFADILAELRKLRRLDLTETHPAVIFDAAAAFGGESET